MDTFAYIWLALLAITFIGTIILDVVEVSKMDKDTPKKYDKIHDKDKEKVMNKRERIEELEKQVEELKETQEYLLHKDEPAIIKTKIIEHFFGNVVFNVWVKYANSFEHKMQTIDLGEYTVADRKPNKKGELEIHNYRDDIEILKETNTAIYIKIKDTINVISKTSGVISSSLNECKINELNELIKPKKKAPKKK